MCFNHQFKCFIFQLDDIKLMKDHQTGRSAGYGFITVCYSFYGFTLSSHNIGGVLFYFENIFIRLSLPQSCIFCDLAHHIKNVCSNDDIIIWVSVLFELFKFSCVKLSRTLGTSNF